ncbi:hypothetical protein D840_01232 [Enterococcus faecalis 20.SD.W.06]|nr:hypothetical protein D840_01232 [Enterococcus faecalis 20.SD.W.06]
MIHAILLFYVTFYCYFIILCMIFCMIFILSKKGPAEISNFDTTTCYFQ